tara:strand:- start:330 stop:983 length:654 start_codon:yes stop_codon:yes gene_type:complete
MKKITAIVPVRKGSQRVRNKNIRPFCGTNLLSIKLDTLKQVAGVDEIVVSTDCDIMLDLARAKGVTAVTREPYYASSECTNSEFFQHVAENLNTDYILYSPVTSPLISVETYNEVIKTFREKGKENIVTASLVKHHMWLNGKPLNYDIRNSPNSQDLPDIVSLNYACNIIAKDAMVKYRNIVTENPHFYILDEIESMDIDTEFDFMVAEMIYNKLKK